MDYQKIIKTALNMRSMSYVPYSNFAVGAGLQTTDGTVYGGCNIENASYTPTNCAERTAFFKAISEGKREFTAIAIAGGPKDSEPVDYCSPCGVCRQVMTEFCNPDTFEIVLVKSETEYQVFTLKELMPLGFGPGNLNIDPKA
jgi:cytidine deaminase